MATVQDVREVAKRVAEASQAGDESVTIYTQKFDLLEGGMCLRFVRQCHEAAAGLPAHEWRFDSRYAIWADHAMRKARLEVADPEVADVVCFNRGKSIHETPGHIGIYLGRGWVAENTSSWRRGNPRRLGTKISTLDEIGRDRAMFFQTVPMAGQETLVVGPDGQVIDCQPEWVGQRITVRAAPLLLALGLEEDNPAVHANGRAFLRELEQYTPGWGFYYRDMAQGPRVYVKRVAP